jgi:hypothetical protein
MTADSSCGQQAFSYIFIGECKTMKLANFWVFLSTVGSWYENLKIDKATDLKLY